jgi:small-conductance mechanosensitive channel
LSEIRLESWLETFSSPFVRIGIVLGATLLVVAVLELGYRYGFRRFAARTRSQLDDRVFSFLHTPIRRTVVALGLSLCVPLIAMPEGLARVLLLLIKSVMILVWMVALIRVLSTGIRHAGSTGRISYIQPRTVPLFDTTQKVFVTGAAIYFVFLTWNIDVTGWVASAGIVGIAVGFAAKDSLANLFSGVFILVDAPYKIGDMILLDSGERGRVTDVGIRSTRILTRDDVEVTIPNSAIGAAKISNESGGPHRKRRVDVRVGVAYSSDIELVRGILAEIAEELDIVCAQPEARVRFRAMGDSSLIFSLLFWIDDPELRGQAVDRVNTRIMERFRESGVEIPFPQRVVHLPAEKTPEPRA